jgi:D-cysteine desulfhydrase family pyridoxal phosphate-dependent enzyme
MKKNMIKKEEFAHLPTTIESLPRLTKLFNGPEILIKRDDQTGLALGGNKTRKLEYLIADAKGQGAKMVLTTGAAQSNHCRQTAAAAARCGLSCKLVLVGPEPEGPTSNLFLDQLLGAEISWADKSERDQALTDAYQNAKIAGKEPYLIPYGGSNALGAYAYVKAYEELEDQLAGKMPDWIVFASSSGGTQAGLVAGSLRAGSATRVLGISVDQPADVLGDDIRRIISELEDLLSIKLDYERDAFLVNDGFIGDGYGMMNSYDREAIHLFAQYEGILLDPVYTGRAGAGLISLIKSNFFKKGEKVVFWHTGGTPALFADDYLPKI